MAKRKPPTRQQRVAAAAKREGIGKKVSTTLNKARASWTRGPGFNSK